MLVYKTGKVAQAQVTNQLTGESLPQWMQRDRIACPLSKTGVTTTLSVFGTEEKLTLPLITSTTVWEVKQLLATRMGIEPTALEFITKQGCFHRKQRDVEEIRRHVIVRGISSFSRVKKAWNHPLTIIGAGHLGLRLALYFLKHKEVNIVIYDAKDDVGGTSWIDQANSTSKLQTELGTYHLQFDEDNPVPRDMPTWPTRDQLLAHFRQVSDDYGLYPYIRFNTTVKSITVEKGDPKRKPADQWYVDQSYTLSLDKIQHDAGTKQQDVQASAVFCFPGNLSVSRRETYSGEDLFEGPIHYAMCDNVDYSICEGQEVAVIGHGAFAVENVRTCCEFAAKKVWLICRRKNLSCPRISSWFINQSHSFISGKLMLKSFEPMYDLIGFDPWSYYAVISSEKRTTVSINQKARFGIGDVYFLAIAMGVCEVVVGKIHHLSKHTVHLQDGQKLNSTVMLKLLGFTGHWDNDRIMGVKEMVGFWVNDDFRRVLFAEPTSVIASNFGGTSFSPGARAWVEYFAHFCWFPKDFAGVYTLLPRHQAEPENDRPAYVIDARHGTTTGVTLDGAVLAFQESSVHRGPVKRNKQLECHPLREFLEECKAEWDDYAQKLQNQGAPLPMPAYPYTHALIERFLADELAELQMRPV